MSYGGGYGGYGGFGGGGMYPSGMPMMPMGQGGPPGASQPGIAGARLAENGLYVVDPDPEDVHDAQEYVKLNVTEGVKYGEMWAEAAHGEDLLPGKEAVAFFGRAADVTRSQLRLVWDISDHTKRGSLNKDEFFIALRLIALAQRGAELSVNGLRNFTGIQLLPVIKQVEAPPPPTAPTSAMPPSAGVSAPGEDEPLQLWQVSPAQGQKYDNYFNSLDDQGLGYIDGLQGVTFFSKSGLPRPILKALWGLADISVDGRLDREEFRQAMHLVTMVRRGKVTLDELPPSLDPSGPYWVRVMHTGPQAAVGAPGMMQPQGEASLLGEFAPPAPTMASPNASHSETPIPGRRPEHTQNFVPEAEVLDRAHEANSRGQLSSWQEDPTELRSRLRDASMAEQRAKQQMEEMQRELQRLQMEKSQMANEGAARNLEVQRMRAEYQDMMSAKAAAERRANDFDQRPASSAARPGSATMPTTSTPTPQRGPIDMEAFVPSSGPGASSGRNQNDDDSLSSDDEDFWGDKSLKPPPMGPSASASMARKVGDVDEDWVF